MLDEAAWSAARTPGPLPGLLPAGAGSTSAAVEVARKLAGAI
ncbi:hypothetical protein BQ8794_240319 [Mesorhizobium prunaredense]|uniref:Uncharacterized protein n=1 Tax=Mesorhizobium prunaredense TaxID=1631249 RepID=A0A1R3VA36_9HYPH|nr:hypothetical protein BQ8794_240319 [Mesorhizobium prunaredense]